MLEWIVYPLLLICSYMPAFINLMILPTLMALWLIDESIFVEWDDKKTGQNWPKEGYPTLIAREFLLLGLLWGDYTYLLNENDLHISFALMLFMYLQSWTIMFDLLLLPVIIPWAMLSLYQILVIVAYEVLVLDISFDDEDPKAKIEKEEF